MNRYRIRKIDDRYHVQSQMFGIWYTPIWRKYSKFKMESHAMTFLLSFVRERNRCGVNSKIVY